jgi:hypothetical protein
LSEEGATLLDLQDRVENLAASAAIPRQKALESHQLQENSEHKREPNEMSGLFKILREQRRETTRTMGEAWKRLTKRSRKGKGRMENLESDDDAEPPSDLTNKTKIVFRNAEEVDQDNLNRD